MNKYLSISAITRYLKSRFDGDANLHNVFLKGEISNFKAHTSGHFYFSLKDESSKINAIMFRSNASKVLFKPSDGMKVLVTGRISVYEAMGGYQIYVDEMIEDGIGNLYIAYEKLKKKLMEEGLFDENHKNKIPMVPKNVGIITAPTGAAIRDILTTIKRRFPICHTILFPTLVQGEKAGEDICRSIKMAESYDLDVLIIGRGGGSIEDLWPFNEEIVARAIYDCKVPIISAVGHEIDFTIADFVSDLRAPTPTAAAELAVPNMVDLINKLSIFKSRLNEGIKKKVNFQKLYLDSLKSSYVIKNPMIMYEGRKQKLDMMCDNINNLLINIIRNNRERLNIIKKSFIFTNPYMLYKDKKEIFLRLKNNYILSNPSVLYKDSQNKVRSIIDKLELLNPLNILSRGYTLTYLEDKTVKNACDIKEGDILDIKFRDGNVKAKTLKVEEEK